MHRMQSALVLQRASRSPRRNGAPVLAPAFRAVPVRRRIGGQRSGGANYRADTHTFSRPSRTLEDFAEVAVDDSLPALYQGSVKQLDESGIPCRVLRTELVGCGDDIEYLCKLHCIRLAFHGVFHLAGAEQWFTSAGRSLLSDLLRVADKDPRDVLDAYDSMMTFVRDTDQRFKMVAEMEHRGVKVVTFYDVLLDFILMDAFEDLTAPPSSVLAVINNRWLSNGFKEGALATAAWSMLHKAKRRELLYSDGFISHFYSIMEHLSPVLVWGFLGPQSGLKTCCFSFKEQVENYLQDIFNFHWVRYNPVEEMAVDVQALGPGQTTARRDPEVHQRPVTEVLAQVSEIKIHELYNAVARMRYAGKVKNEILVCIATLPSGSNSNSQ